MNEVYRVIGAAARRLLVIDFIRAMVWCLTGAVAGVIIARLVERIFGLTFPWFAPYGGVFAWAGAAAAVVGAGWTYAARRRVPVVARELDERAGLRESLSTALYAERQSNDPWCNAVIETARARAVSTNVRQAIPLVPPRQWPAPILGAMLLALLWFTVPAFDVLKILERRTTEQKQAAAITEVKRDLEDKQKKLDELVAKAKLDLKQDEASKLEDPKANEPMTPEELQRAAIKTLTDVSERLADMKNGEKGEEDKAIHDKMAQLKQPGDGPLNELSRAMARGDFAKAEEALKDLENKLNSGNMTQAEKDAAQKQLNNLADQLKKLAQDRQEMQQKLEAAGLDAQSAKDLMQKMAQDPAAAKEMMQKAMEAMKGLSDAQKQQLMQQIASQCKAGGQCDKMGQSMSQMAQAMSQQGMDSQAMDSAMSDLKGQVSDMAMSQQEMQAMDDAMSECRAQLEALGNCLGDGELQGPPGLSEWQAGKSDSRGNGSGGKGGYGNYGGKREDNPADFTTKKEKASTKTNSGPIIGSQLVYGAQVRGESVAAFSQAVEASEKAAAEAIESYQVPRELQPAVKKYFGTLSEAAGKPAGSPAPAPKAPAEDAKDAGKK
ncbi:MAG: hypothetical protein IT301_09175 [Dehalococcoidia bacterium]|nr:hypothetical protein [Dehalococcoidia bacterium]